MTPRRRYSPGCTEGARSDQGKAASPANIGFAHVAYARSGRKTLPASATAFMVGLAGILLLFVILEQAVEGCEDLLPAIRQLAPRRQSFGLRRPLGCQFQSVPQLASTAPGPALFVPRSFGRRGAANAKDGDVEGEKGSSSQILMTGRLNRCPMLEVLSRDRLFGRTILHRARRQIGPTSRPGARANDRTGAAPPGDGRNCACKLVIGLPVCGRKHRS